MNRSRNVLALQALSKTFPGVTLPADPFQHSAPPSPGQPTAPEPEHCTKGPDRSLQRFINDCHLLVSMFHAKLLLPTPLWTGVQSTQTPGNRVCWCQNLSVPRRGAGRWPSRMEPQAKCRCTLSSLLILWRKIILHPNRDKMGKSQSCWGERGDVK